MQNHHRTSEVSDERKRRRIVQDPAKTNAQMQASSQELGLLEEGYGEPAVESHAALLTDPRLSHPSNAGRKARMLNQLQRHYGNAYIQRVVDRAQAMREEPIQMKAAEPTLQRQTESFSRWVEEEEEPTFQAKAISGSGNLKIQRRVEEEKRHGQMGDGRAKRGTTPFDITTLDREVSPFGEMLIQGKPTYHSVESADSYPQVVQLEPITRGVMITELRRYGMERLRELVSAEEAAVNEFIDELIRRMEGVTDFWSFLIGGAGAGGVGVAAGASHPVLAAFGVLFGGVGVLWSRDRTRSSCRGYLSAARRRLLRQVAAHGREYEPVIQRLATEFGNSVSEGDLDTDRYPSLFQRFARESLQVPSVARVRGQKWNQLCFRWNDYVRASDFYRGYTATAERLLVSPRLVPER